MSTLAVLLDCLGVSQIGGIASVFVGFTSTARWAQAVTDGAEDIISADKFSQSSSASVTGCSGTAFGCNKSMREKLFEN